MNGKHNIALGFIVMGGFMLYGFYSSIFVILPLIKKHGLRLTATASTSNRDSHTCMATYSHFLTFWLGFAFLKIK